MKQQQHNFQSNQSIGFLYSMERNKLPRGVIPHHDFNLLLLFN